MIRIISCMDVKNNYVVKGINFKKLKKINNVFFLSINYLKKKIDEITLLDITANYTKKSLSNKLIKKISKKINIPLSIGGGINCFKLIKKYFNLGADKIIINSFSYKKIEIIKNFFEFYGTQALIISIDIKKKKKKYFTYKNSGFIKSNFLLLDWIIILKKIGSGELLITSINKDGLCKGYDIKIYYFLKKILKTLIIISGGFGAINDLYFLYKKCSFNTFLIASIFHKNYLKPKYLQKYIKKI
ncbi:imidazoleglycerol-phosphate synthase [Candidatus Carsonella ruddii CS isolate Thao2000]|uniref:Imidazoleglycerol-phosphate synthase n=1 Tax=Candidatus Carsonella ruddii CS isolate Thao2000 TaxID=1202537 RepID=J7GYQ8_CARRU|nr:HisA/HisF-related TIM barrel protein [Candidatus Carsonella ruddii]AFP83733.1 imidazoleglycerol-phosphate synthase [Candidatus Carsonella ruddii CS isolate Thao2000]